jgi:predicted RNA-binding Zn ribbon-like protein
VATPVDVVVDWVGDGEGLVAWLRQAQLVPNAILDTLERQTPPRELDKVADQARNLREWFRGFVHAHKGKRLEAKHLRELEPLNRLLGRDETFKRIVPSDTRGQAALDLRAERRWRTPESLLLPIGEALAQLVCTEDFADVKACEGPSCTLLFADHTRGRGRRWCTMAICGNRAKQAAHRRRLREA